MDRSLRFVSSRWPVAVRWLLLGAIIAGILAMHVLNAANSGGGHRGMPMSASGNGSARMTTGMAMPGIDQAVPDGPATATQLSAVPGTGMSPMSCCVLFLVSAAGLLVLRRTSGGQATTGPAASHHLASPGIAQRGPPGAVRPRIALSIQRV